MKLISKLSLLLLAGSLVGCGLVRPDAGKSNNGGNGGNSGNKYSVEPYVTPSESDDGYVEPEEEDETFPRYNIPAPEEVVPEEPQEPAWQGFTPKDPVIGEPVTVYTPEEVLKDLVCSTGSYNYDAETLAQYGYIEQEGEDLWFGQSVTYYRNQDSDQLVDVCTYFLGQSGKIPAYLGVIQAPRASTLQNGDPCVVAFLGTGVEPTDVFVQVLGFVDESDPGYEGTYFTFLAAYGSHFMN